MICKEIACDTCTHRNVCLYKDTFVSAYNAVNDVMVHYENNRMMRLRDIVWIKPVNLQCTNYYKENGVSLR